LIATGISWPVLGALPLGLAACSSGAPPTQTEEDLHAIGPNASQLAHPHLFLCADRERMLVDFGDDGLSLRIRQPADRPPIVLTAPAQGAAFRGAGLNAIFKGQELRMIGKDGSVRICLRQSKG
jgi:hypothetical protein